MITGAVLSGVGIGVGAILTVVSNSKASAAETKWAALVSAGGPSACGSAALASGCGALSDTLKQRAEIGDAAIWTFVGAGALSVATAVYALTPRGKAVTAVQVAPLVGAYQNGLIVRGTW